MDDGSRFEEIHRLFDAVQEMPADERPERLAELCDDASLREEVLGLFDHDSATALAGVERVIQHTLGGSIDGPPTVAGYKVNEIIGSGAMGVVYRAEQQSPKRDVAIKVIRGGGGSPALLRRFRSEAEALARLRHAGIATVHQTGVERSPTGDRPFLVMELVEGEPLNHWIDRVSPSARERFELVRKICDAVQHAHSRGVVHRDLKPSNILITDDGEPKLIDFGVARISDPSSTISMHTAAGEVVGTLAYMSPEQLSGDPTAVDTRSDVYALGVILFYVLSGTLPHDVTTMSIAAAARVIEQGTPKRLSSIKPTFGGDPETIVSKALEKDKDRRYQTAEALGEDIQRYLAGMPINARPASTLYVLGRLARRNRPAVAAALLVVAALVAASVISTRSAITTKRALAESQLSATRVENINQFFVVDILTAGTTRAMGADARVIDVVEKLVPLIGERFEGDPIGEADVRLVVGSMLFEAGQDAESMEQFDLAYELLEGFGEGEYRRMISVISTRANAHTTFGRPRQGIEEAESALALIDEMGLADDDELRIQVLTHYASALQSEGRIDEAEPILDELIERILAEGEPYPRFLLGAYTYKYQALIQREGTEKQQAELILQIERVSESFEDAGAKITALTFVAARHEKAGDAASGLEVRKRTLELAREHAIPGSYQYREAVINAGLCHAMNGLFAEGLVLIEEGYHQILDAYGPRHYETERLTRYMAFVNRDLGNTEAFERWQLRRFVLRFFVAGPHELGSMQRALANGSTQLGSDEAMIGLLLEEPDPDHRYLGNLGWVLAERDDPRAEELLDRAMLAFDPGPPTGDQDDLLATLRSAYPGFLERAGRPEEAAELRARLDRFAEDLAHDEG